MKEKQGQIRGRSVMDGQAGAVMQNLFAIQKYFGDRLTGQSTWQGKVFSRLKSLPALTICITV